MMKYKIIIKIISYIIIIYSFYNLYFLKNFFHKDKLPIQSGQFSTKKLKTPDFDAIKSDKTLTKEIVYTEDETNFYTFTGNPDKIGRVKNTFYIQKDNNNSVIDWSPQLQRWIKIGNISNMNRINFKKDFLDYLDTYDNKNNFKGKNLGCVVGNDKHNVVSCKVWKNNFGIGNETVPVTIRETPQILEQFYTQSKDKNNYSSIIIISLAIFFSIILIIIFLLKKNK